MSDSDPLDYHRAADRIGHILAVLAAAGAVAALALRGWRWGLGFLLGSFLAFWNYRWLRRAVEALGGEHPKSPRRVFLVLRFLLLAGAAYAIVRYTSVSLPAVFAGIFTLTGAVIIEAVVEIVYARK